MRFAAASSRHPSTRDAVGEIVGAVLEQLPDPPDLAAVFFSPHHLAAAADLASSITHLLTPGALVGTSAVSVVSGGQELEQQPAIALWAVAGIGEVPAFHLDAVSTGEGYFVTGLPVGSIDERAVLLVLGDPFSLPVDSLFAQLRRDWPGLRVVGGMASAAAGPGGNRLLCGDRLHTEGGVGVLLPPSAGLDVVVSQGCRPVGEPMVVTRSEGNVLLELAGRPAFQRLVDLVRDMSESDRELATQGLHIGTVIDEHRDVFERGDFLIRAVLGVDEEAGAVAAGAQIPVGTTVQFQLRDARSADDDLRSLLLGREGDAALLFTCNGRGSAFFGSPDHDATLVNATVEGGATAGMFCAGEVGPVGGRNFLHGFTACVALFGGAAVTEGREAGR